MGIQFALFPILLLANTKYYNGNKHNTTAASKPLVIIIMIQFLCIFELVNQTQNCILLNNLNRFMCLLFRGSNKTILCFKMKAFLFNVFKIILNKIETFSSNLKFDLMKELLADLV
jgi:hypothetical protein